MRHWGHMGVRALLLAGAAVLLWPAAGAQAVQGIGLSPATQEIDVTAGKATSYNLTVLNDGTEDVTYRFRVADYRVQGEDYQGDFTSTGASANVSAVSWFSLPTGTFTIKAREQRVFEYTVTPPAGAVVGGHYAAVFVETVPPPNPGGTRIARVERVGMLVYLAVDGQLQRGGNIVSLDVPWLQATAPLQAALRLRNSGNVHFAAEGSLQLSTWFGNVGPPVPFKGEVLPSTIRRFTSKLPSKSPIGLYKVTAKVKYLDREETVARWVLLMPKLTFIIISGTLLVLLVAGFWWLVRRRRRRADS